MALTRGVKHFASTLRLGITSQLRGIASVKVALDDLTHQYEPDYFRVDGDVKKTFDTHGVILLRNLLDTEEITKLKSSLEHDEGVLSKAYYVCDDDGGVPNARLCVWNHPGNDITGMLARCEKVAGTMDQLMEGEMYHYHTKLMMKEPGGGGRWGWHQDFGYWHKNGCLFPDMATCFVAVDPCMKSNGCLNFIPGSHKCGRLDHHKIAGQYEADKDCVDQLTDKFGITPFEMNPGDAAIFHSNTLHQSSRNVSEQRRWAFVMAYNMATNNPTKKHHHPRYVPIIKVPNTAIKECVSATDMRGKGFITQTDPNDAYKFNIEDDHLN